MSEATPSPRALLDANALWSPVLRDTLLRAAEYKLFLPLWSNDILEELVRTILAKRPGTRADNLARTVAHMRAAFPRSTVDGYAWLIPQLSNHPGDRHVLVAAIHGRVEAIVTWNRRHFLPAAEQFGIGVNTPDTFLCQPWEDHSEVIRMLLAEQGAALRPPHSLDDILRSLQRSNIRQFAALVGSGPH